MKISKIKKELKKGLTPYRYNHSLLVAKEAKNLAKRYHLDKKKAYLAGLLHDIAKELSEEENTYWIEKENLSKELYKNEYKNIKHADIGAEIAKEKYKIDNSIYHAIKYHTIGNKEMNLLAKIIYIADKTGRKNLPRALTEIKKLSYQDIDQALVCCIEKQEKKLKQSGVTLHKDTEELLKELKEKQEKKLHASIK